MFKVLTVFSYRKSLSTILLAIIIMLFYCTNSMIKESVILLSVILSRISFPQSRLMNIKKVWFREDLSESFSNMRWSKEANFTKLLKTYFLSNRIKLEWSMVFALFYKHALVILTQRKYWLKTTNSGSFILLK